MGRLAVISDMDGVIYRGKKLIPGAQDFVAHLRADDIPFLFLTNNSEQTPLDLVRKLEGLGIHGLTEANFITAAIATAAFLNAQRPRSTAYVVGGNGLAAELYKVGYSITETNPEYVVVGKTANFSFADDAQGRAADRRRARGSSGPTRTWSTRSRAAPSRRRARSWPRSRPPPGSEPYIVGKPNSLMMIFARQMLGAHAEDCVMIGDRMDTDIVGGLEAGMRTVLVLSGVSSRETVEQFPYRPDFVFDDVGHDRLGRAGGRHRRARAGHRERSAEPMTTASRSPPCCGSSPTRSTSWASTCAATTSTASRCSTARASPSWWARSSRSPWTPRRSRSVAPRPSPATTSRRSSTSAFALPRRTDAIVAVGGGMAIDYAKYAGFLTRKPVIAVPTALSNDGFASPGASLKVAGQARQLPGADPVRRGAGHRGDRQVAAAVHLLRASATCSASTPPCTTGSSSYWETGEQVNDFAVLIALQSVENLVHPPEQVASATWTSSS